MRGMRRSTKELRAQGGAYAKATAKSDQERARETAQELIRELESIEIGLKQELNAKA